MHNVLDAAAAAAAANPAPPPRRSGGPRFRLEASWADSVETLREAQRLRFQVFAGEHGARLSPPPGTPPGHDADRFDAFLRPPPGARDRRRRGQRRGRRHLSAC
jgi:putative hemolysin